MKNSQKGFVVPLLIGIIVLLVIAGAYYFGTTSKNSSEPTVALVNKCMEDGNKFALDYKQANTFEGNTWYDPQYHFSTKLNTCLTYVFYTVYFPTDQTIQSYKTIYDVYSNKALLQSVIIKTYVSAGGKQQETDTVVKYPLIKIPNLDEAAFSDQSKVLMSE